MNKPGKPISRNSNSKFTTRHNKQDIFSKFTKAAKQKSEQKMRITDETKENPE